MGDHQKSTSAMGLAGGVQMKSLSDGKPPLKQINGIGIPVCMVQQTKLEVVRESTPSLTNKNSETQQQAKFPIS